ncbi:MAG TPA: response regulator [Polyangiales bacterium]|nr:response regulator [Polyangiales bacterium]
MTQSTILAVDDDPVNLHIIGEVFKREPVTITYAQSGESALNLLSDPRNSFDVVLLDRMMTGLDGIEVLKRMKSEPRLSHMPVVMQTAAAAPEEVCEGLTAGAHYYLTKPYAPSTLRTIVRAALEHVRDRRELESRAGNVAEAVMLLDRAEFSVKNHLEAQRVAGFVSQLCPEPKVAVLGLAELMINGIEHGNLGITCSEKSALLREDRMAEELRRRHALPENALRRVTLRFERSADELLFEVRDDGKGFDYKKYLELDPERAFEPNGRGIALARMLSFGRLEYQGVGNVVVAAIKIAPPAPSARG